MIFPKRKVSGKIRLKIGRFAGSCVKAEGNGKQAIAAWPPYILDADGMAQDGYLRVTDVLTRRNTFGPLHQVPAVCGSYGPENFETRGECFTESYSLVEAGFLSPFVVEYGK